MAEVRVIEIHENVTAMNDMTAQMVREMLTEKGTCFLNVMSSPGSGKTTLLTALINRMKDKVKIAEMDVDIESSVDAQRVADATGVPSIQIHNGGLCHIDADMTARAIAEFEAGDVTSDAGGADGACGFASDCGGADGAGGVSLTDDVDLLILENIGNLVCPAEFDTGAHKNIMLLSVPEGDDKPLKYPLMFTVSDIVLITKVDTAGFFNFDFEAAQERILKLNPKAVILPVSAKTGEGMEELEQLIMKEVEAVKAVKAVKAAKA